MRRRRRAALAPDEIDALLDEAAAHYASGALSAASEIYCRVEDKDAEDIRARYSQAVIDLRTGRAVGAVDVDQVRQPIYRTSVERWRRYEAQLAPLRAVLQAGSEKNVRPVSRV